MNKEEKVLNYLEYILGAVIYTLYSFGVIFSNKILRYLTIFVIAIFFIFIYYKTRNKKYNDKPFLGKFYQRFVVIIILYTYISIIDSNLSINMKLMAYGAGLVAFTITHIFSKK
ncbi:hypothetical protein KQI41_02205 [Tissierella pigra]|uniref:Uncharacterized protein n=1 Tax=Tissierella pigra TaxID=2607614 RepID=A0A6N7XL58_9FIRM|nr:hypothetical protein [Tissierella pigra]MBU5425212.1 hypothetical protein [Tissierella pigra]MSU02769.1 hypothetical protein [Tissierella pigra]